MMKKLNDRFHTWYDSFQDPMRFIIMITVSLPCILMVTWGDELSIWNGLGLVALILLIISRRAYLIK